MKKFYIFVFSFCMVLSLGGCRKEQPYASPDEKEALSVEVSTGGGPAAEVTKEVAEAEEVEVPYDKRPMVMIKEELCYDTGKESDIAGRSAPQDIPTDEQPSGAPQAQETNAGESPADPLGLYLETADVTPAGLTLIIHQSGGSPTGALEAGTPYQIEQETSGIWIPLPPLRDLTWEDLAMRITKEDLTVWPIDWTSTYGPLSPGHYRLKKEIMDYRSPGDYDLHPYYAQFTLPN